MSRELIVAWIGRQHRGGWEGPVEEYRRRIERMHAVRDLPVRVRLGGEDPRRQRAEEEAVRQALPSPCWTVLLDSRGRSQSSEEFAAGLSKRFDSWPHPVAFLIGSDLGWSDEMRRWANEVLSFGPLTLPHELARTVLYEQLYRALCIWGGIKYHRAPL